MIKKCTVVLLAIIISSQNFLWCMNQQRASQDQTTKVVAGIVEELKKKSLPQNDVELPDIQSQPFDKAAYLAQMAQRAVDQQQQQPANNQVTQDPAVAARKQDLIQRAVNSLKTNEDETIMNMPTQPQPAAVNPQPVQTVVSRRSNNRTLLDALCEPKIVGSFLCCIILVGILGVCGVFGGGSFLLPKGS